ncbi:hypothetical protein [Pyrobaculum calidifontis]|uniref:hypothetical protein n=1 Tax=Pyrobaculum calidifontis TaxID=181486 RepID=UPI000B26F826|nr:hypothetical protein [Pyrobaculum calidifontis]
MNGEEVKREAVRSYTGLPTYDVMREDWRREAYTPLLSAVGNSPDNPQGAPELSPQSPPLSVSVNPSNSPQSVSATPEPSPQPPPAPLPPSPHPTPLSPSIEELSGVVVRTGVLFRRYYLKLKDAEARPGDVLVVVGRDWYVLRPAPKADVWVGDGVIRLRGEAVRFSLNAIPQKLLLDYAAQVAWGKTALVAVRVPRARLKWPRRYDPEVSPFARDLAEIAQSPALVALVRLSDKGAKRTALSWLSKGAYAYCHAVNQLLQSIGVGVRLIC